MDYINSIKNIIYILLLYFGLSNYLSAQDSTAVRILNKDFFVFDKATQYQLLSKDTFQNQIQNYFSRNRMGAIGAPDLQLILQPKDEQIGARWFIPGYDNSLKLQNDRNYYETNSINTSVFAAAGSAKEQVLKMHHFQKIGNDFHLNFKLNRITSENFYQYQKSFINNVRVSAHSLNNKKRFGFRSSLTFDRFKHNENGGIANDTIIPQDVFINKNLVPVRLKNAKRDYRVLAGEAFLTMRLTKDSLSYIGHYLHAGAIASVTKSEFFDDPSTKYYDTTFINPSATHDSICFSKFTPEISYQFVAEKFSFLLSHQSDYIKFATLDTSYNCLSQIASLSGSANFLNKTLIVKEKFDYIWNGFNSGNYKFNLDGIYSLSFLNSKLNFQFIAENRSPDLFYRHYKSNYIIWRNQFQPVSTQSASLFWACKKYNLTAGVVFINQTNFIFINEFLQPQQIEKSINALRSTIEHTFHIYKFNFTNTIHFQNQQHIAFALPKWFTQHQFFFRQLIKKNGMVFQAGLQADFISNLAATKYDPALNSFTIIEKEKLLNGIYFIDFFTSLNFKELTFFIKTEHINQGFNASNFSLMQNYYQRDRSFRFGLKWNFFD